MEKTTPRTAQHSSELLILLLITAAILPGCGLFSDATCQNNLTSCQAALNTTTAQRNQFQTQRDQIQGAYDQYRQDTTQTINGLHHDLNDTQTRAEYWREVAENQTITVGILQERITTLQDKKQDTRNTGWISLLIEILLGISMIALERTLTTVEPHFKKYKPYRNMIWAALFCAIIATVIILTISTGA